MEVSGATFTNGLLHIDLVRNIPEALAPQRIAIGQPRAQDDERVIEGERPALSHSETENQ